MKASSYWNLLQTQTTSNRLQLIYQTNAVANWKWSLMQQYRVHNLTYILVFDHLESFLLVVYDVLQVSAGLALVAASDHPALEGN